VTRSSITTCTPRASRSTLQRGRHDWSATEDSNVYEHTVGLNPATKSRPKIELFDLEATDRAIALAASVATAWRDLTPASERICCDDSPKCRRHVEELAQLEVANSGHTIGTLAGRPATSQRPRLLLRWPNVTAEADSRRGGVI